MLWKKHWTMNYHNGKRNMVLKLNSRISLAFRLEKILQVAAEQTGHGAVVLIDEYDKPLLDVLEMDPELLNNNREILKGFYSTFKKADAYLRFVFLTGVTKFSQVSVFSGFNQPKDISMYEQFEALCGITEEELHTQFAESIREMAQAARIVRKRK